ncbi:hypothetical protein B0T16DRAFT_8520 [Cercophora newfieldiana]|uniref:Uncharacterized protein n=1 Tax=Cercophora newfieldiana TaxID=92897 RepID=A0AA39YMI2_9PEZI|nr:hypothetical protein B0T16DRAFT_8520 [Cercophora newfieldiana]
MESPDVLAFLTLLGTLCYVSWRLTLALWDTRNPSGPATSGQPLTATATESHPPSPPLPTHPIIQGGFNISIREFPTLASITTPKTKMTDPATMRRRWSNRSITVDTNGRLGMRACAGQQSVHVTSGHACWCSPRAQPAHRLNGSSALGHVCAVRHTCTLCVAVLRLPACQMVPGCILRHRQSGGTMPASSAARVICSFCAERSS